MQSGSLYDLQQSWLMETVRLLLQVPRRNIVLLCGLIAGYEGMAVVRTIDPTRGLVELLVAPAFHDTALTLVHHLAREMDLHLIDPGDAIPPSETPDCDRNGR
jgi:hypothetical protein